MVGRVIRKLGSLLYEYPKVPEDVEQPGRFGRLKIALVSDNFTADCLSVECRVRAMTPDNYKEVIGDWKPDLVFVESVFHGIDGSWRYELAKQSKLLRLSKPKAIFHLIEFARSRGIPTVFWNKDDGAYFDAFIDVAKAFDYVFTTDKACVEKYHAQVPDGVPVNVLMMPYQPLFHHFTGFKFSGKEACFTGSYYRRILGERKSYLDMIFDASGDAGLGLNVFDRNHDRISRYFAFRYPSKAHLKVYPRVSHRDTAQIYKDHVASINVNSVTGSESMVSRRLLEILACGGIAVTNPSRAVDKHFRDYCHVAATREEMLELFTRLKYGPSRDDLERAEGGAMHVRRLHTWEHRLEDLCRVVNI